MDLQPPPDPCLREVVNDTPFELFQCDKMGVGRRYFDTVVLKGTFALTPERLPLAEVQLPIALADELWDEGDAERSSIKVAGEVVLTKPTTDVIVTGHARAPGPDPLSEWPALVEIRGRDGLEVDYGAHVVGPHAWRFTHAHGWVLPNPEPTLAVPIRYELAFGGAYAKAFPEELASPGVEWVVHEANPCGSGFFEERYMDESREYSAPQWLPDLSFVGRRDAKVPLVGFGPVARPWPARLKYAGTYDERWIARTRAEVAQGMPADYAADFNPRYFQCANPALVMPRYLEGSEIVRLTGLLPGDEPFVFQLPCVLVRAETVNGANESAAEQLPLDTVHIDVDAATVSLCWRLTLDQARDIRGASFHLAGIT